MYNRLVRLDDPHQSASFDARLKAGLRPAPELRLAIDLIVASLRARAGGSFHCLQVSAADESRNQERVYALGARLLGQGTPTLLADASAGEAARAHMKRFFEQPLFLDELILAVLQPAIRALLLEGRESADHHTAATTGSSAAHARGVQQQEAGYNGTAAQQQPTAGADSAPQQPHESSAATRFSLAYELVEVHVCAAADEFAGNMLTPYAHSVCYERDGVLAGSAKSELGRRQCRDLYSRDEASIKASRAGRIWF